MLTALIASISDKVREATETARMIDRLNAGSA